RHQGNAGPCRWVRRAGRAGVRRGRRIVHPRPGRSAGRAAVGDLPAEPSIPTVTAAIERFEIRVEDTVLDDLQERLARTRWPDQIEGTGWEHGIQPDYVRDLVAYLREAYDRRA